MPISSPQETKIFVDEFKAAMAFDLPDLCIMVDQLLEAYPEISEACYTRPPCSGKIAWLMAHAWEAGRTYGLRHVLATLEHEFMDMTEDEVAEQAADTAQAIEAIDAAASAAHADTLVGCEGTHLPEHKTKAPCKPTVN